MVNESIKFVYALERSRVKFFGHLLRHKEFFTLKVRVLGERGRGRTKKPYLEDQTSYADR